jgi:hypothetical protein
MPPDSERCKGFMSQRHDPNSRKAARCGRSFRHMTDISAIPAATAAQIATSAIRKSQNDLRKDASVVASQSDPSSQDAITAMVDARQQVLYTKAAAKIIGTSDEMIKSLIDTHA